MTPAVRRWLDAARARLERATPGPWRHGSIEKDAVFTPYDMGLGCDRNLLRMNKHFPHEEDAALIVAAVNDRAAVLRLVEAVASMRVATTEVRDALAALVGEETEG